MNWSRISSINRISLHPILPTSLAIVAEAVTKGTTTEDMGEGVDGTQTMMVSSPAGRPGATFLGLNWCMVYERDGLYPLFIGHLTERVYIRTI